MEITEADLGRQPLGEQFEVQQLVRRQQGFPFLVGDHRERMMIGALHAPVGDQLVGRGAPDHAVRHQVVEHLGEAQFAVGRGFGGGLHGLHYSGIARPVQILRLRRARVFARLSMLGCPVLRHRAAVVRAANTGRHYTQILRDGGEIPRAQPSLTGA